jgi:EmrB/QacA subfamily drug resistance transporter
VTAVAEVEYASAAGRWVLLACVLGSAMASLDATVVNVALPVIGDDLHAAVSGLQWIVTGYMLTLAALILTGGALGDHYGRRRVFVIGVVWFAASSVGCAAAPNLGLLLAARALQGVGGALLTPGSLALIEATFREQDRGAAIGAWSGLSGVASAIGPFLGGWLISNLSWRWIFLLNLPLSLVVVLVAVRHVPESRDPTSAAHIDLLGAAMTVIGLLGVTFGLIERSASAGVLGALALVAFVVVERRSDHPMLPLGIFGSAQFTGANVVTFVLYGALGGLFFLLVIALEVGLRYSPTAAGASLVPVTLLMLTLSARAGALAQHIGPRIPMSAGPLVVGGGMLMLAGVDPGDHYLPAILPGLVVFGLGLSLTVAPLTAAVLGAADVEHAGIASAVNNSVARVAGLLAVAVLPAIIGLGGRDFDSPHAVTRALHRGLVITGIAAIVSAAIAWATIRRDHPISQQLATESHCALESPPLRPASHCGVRDAA